MRFFPKRHLCLSCAFTLTSFSIVCSQPVMAQSTEPSQEPAENSSSPPNPFGPVKSTVEVRADDLNNQNIWPVRQASRDEIQSSAGTYGDFSRYLLLMPGVVGASDSMNDLMVRGGHPSENLYVVDGLEVPYINHFTVEGTPSGFTPMINTSSISQVELQPGAYDAQYSSRLSSLIELRTRERHESARAGQVNLGIAGLGGFWESPLGNHVDGLFAMDRSLFNLATSDMGLNGVPIYTNGMARMKWSPDTKDDISFLSLSGGDSINVNPCAGDDFETLTIDTQYGGLRSTDGLIWQRTHGPKTISKFTLSFAAQQLNIDQENQLVNGAYMPGMGSANCHTRSTTPVYSENTLDRVTALGYLLRHDLHHWLLSVGATEQTVKLNYAVSQPVGAQSPFNPDPTWTDATNFNENPTTLQTGSYAEVTGPFGKRWTAMGGVRLETFDLPFAHAWEPRVGLGFRISSHQTVHVAYRRSSQLPAYINLLSYPQNHNLVPERVAQSSIGADLWRMSRATLNLEAYRKNYSNESVSTEYPSLMLANMIYTPGQEFVWLPLKAGGTGKATGLELLLRGRPINRVYGIASVTYSRAMYAAADGILRSGNYDIPLVGNALMTFQLPKAIELSARDTYTTGRPYTPYDIPLSVTQSRGIYDLSKVNAVRGPAYNRTDISTDHNFHLPTGILNMYLGMQNIFDRKNFLGYVWLSRCNQIPGCVNYFHGAPMQEIYQMPAFPVAGFRWDY